MFDARMQSHTLTRRSFVQGGGAALTVAAIDLHAWVPALAAGLNGTPAYLRRSSYKSLTGSDFEASFNGTRQKMQLANISDVSAVLAGAEESFSLEFTGSNSYEQALSQGIHTLSHPSLGSFEAFVTAVGPADSGQADSGQAYQMVVDRSVKPASRWGGARTAPTPPPPPTSSSAGADPESSQATPRSGEAVERPIEVHTRRAANGLTVETVLSDTPDASSLRAWLMHEQRLIGVGEHRVRDGRATLEIHTGRRAHAGRYVLMLARVDEHGRESSIEPHSITLR